MIEVRPAQHSDKESIISFCKNTFSWGDYIPEVWDDWMQQGDLLIATYNNAPVGIAHIDYLSGTEAWFEGLRVHPDYRRLGVAQALSKAGFERAKKRGIKVGRALIAGENIASQTLSAANGFVRVADMHFWSGHFSSHEGQELIVRAATLNDINNISEFLRQVPGPIYFWRNWRFVSNTPDNLRKLLENCQLQLCFAPDNSLQGLTIVSQDDDGVKLYSTYALNFAAISSIVNSVCPPKQKVEIGLNHDNFAQLLEAAGLSYQGIDSIWERHID